MVHSDFIDKFCSLQIVKYLQESSMHLQSKWFECKCWKLIDLPGISWAWCTSEGTTCNFSQVQARDHTERDFLCYKHISKMVKKECVMFLYVAWNMSIFLAILILYGQFLAKHQSYSFYQQGNLRIKFLWFRNFGVFEEIYTCYAFTFYIKLFVNMVK